MTGDDGLLPPTGGGLLSPTDVRRLVAELELRPTKTLGQNFVVDPNTVRRIVRTAALSASDIVLEVGPGLGSLTLALLPAVERVVAVEIDPTLAAQLPLTVGLQRPDLLGRLAVVVGDALAITSPNEAPTEVAITSPNAAPTALVANLPYNVSVPVLLHLLEALPSLRTGLVMVQAEVADRLVAGPGSRTYGAPSVKAAWWASLRRAGSVPRTVFWPVPNVDSGLVAFTRREPPPASTSRREVFAVIDAAFAQRRKTLRAALADWAGSAARAEAALRAAGVDPTTRGEQLTVESFARIAEARS